MDEPAPAFRRAPLSRKVVLRSAVRLADHAGIDAVSMRRLAQELGVVPMALYKHVANKEELLDGMVDVVVAEIDTHGQDLGWKAAVRQRILSARQAQLRHPWASQVIKSRTQATPIVLGYLDSLIHAFRAGGFSADLTHHVMHALGSRMWGFTLEVFPTTLPTDPERSAAMSRQLWATYPHFSEIAAAGPHDAGSAIGAGCDDQLEFEFGLDVLLDGFEQLHQHGWTSGDAHRGTSPPRRRSSPNLPHQT
jgi:AcrR family transcriptional regulator